MRAILLSLFLASTAFAQGGIGGYYAPPTATSAGAVPTSRTVGTGTATTTGLSGGGALNGDLSLVCDSASVSSAGCVNVTTQSFVGTKNFTGILTTSLSLRTTAGQKLTFDGATEAKYLSSDGTDLKLTGLNLVTPAMNVGSTATPSYRFQIQGTPVNTVLLGVSCQSATTSDNCFFILGPTVTGDMSLGQFSATATGNATLMVTNNNSSAGGAHAKLELQTTSANGGDPKIVYTISGIANWSTGVDNSDSDKFKLSNSNNLGTSDLYTVTTAGVMTTTGGNTIGTSGTNIAMSPRGTATLDFASALVTACSADLTITVNGAVAGTEVSLGVPNASVAAGSTFYAWVSATNIVSVRHCCGAGTSCDPASGTFAARVFNP